MHEGKFRLRRLPDRLPFSQLFRHAPTRPSDCFNPVGKSSWIEEPTFSVIRNLASITGSPASLLARTREKHSGGGTNGFREGFSGLPEVRIYCPQVPVEIAVHASQSKPVSKWQCGCYGNQ